MKNHKFLMQYGPIEPREDEVLTEYYALDNTVTLQNVIDWAKKFDVPFTEVHISADDEFMGDFVLNRPKTKKEYQAQMERYLKAKQAHEEWLAANKEEAYQYRRKQLDDGLKQAQENVASYLRKIDELNAEHDA